MRKIFVLLFGILACTLVFTGCKTTEANYRKAYEKAVADNDRGVTEFDKTIYSRIRSQMRDLSYTLDGRDVTTRLMRVKVTPDGGGIPEWLRKYSVVVAEFKQLFNAKSMRSRLVDAGYSRTFLVENGEPYYYIVLDSTNDLLQAVELADSVAASFPLPLKEGFPYILEQP